MSTPINNKDTAFNQAWDNLNQGGFQADQSYGRPKIQAVNPHNMMSGAQSSYKNHQAYKDISNSTSVPSITTTRPLLPAQTPLMECYSWHNNNNKQHETITINSGQFYPQNPQTNGAQCYPQNPQTNGAQLYPQNPQTNGAQFYPQNPQTNGAQFYPQNPQTNGAQFYPQNPQTNGAQCYPQNPQTNGAQLYPQNPQTNGAQCYPQNPQTNGAQLYPQNPQTNGAQFYPQNPQTNGAQFYPQNPQTNGAQFYPQNPQTNGAQLYPQNPQTNGAQLYPQNPQTNGAQFYPQTSSGELVVNNAPYGHRYTASTSSLPNNSYQTSTAPPQIQHTYSQTKRTDSPLTTLTTLIRCFQTPKEKTLALTGNLPNLQPKSSTNATKPAPVQAGLEPTERTDSIPTARIRGFQTPKEKTPALTGNLPNLQQKSSTNVTKPAPAQAGLEPTERTDSIPTARIRGFQTPKEKTPALTGNLPNLQQKPSTNTTKPAPAQAGLEPTERTDSTLTARIRSSQTPKEKTPALTGNLPNLQQKPSTNTTKPAPAQAGLEPTKRTDSTLTARIRSSQTPKEKTPALTGNLPNLQQKPSTNTTKPAPAQAGLEPTKRTDSTLTARIRGFQTPKEKTSELASLAWKNISFPEFPIMEERHQELRQVGDVMLPAPPSVTSAEEAKKLLRKEYDNQLQEINFLWIGWQYEHTKESAFTNKRIPIYGSRKNEFREDLNLQLENGNLEIDQCHTPEDINKAFQDQWISMKKQGVYRYWCLRENAPNNPLPHYPGRVSVQSRARSSAIDSSILQLLHSGTMNYFIFRTIPTEKETIRNENNDYKNNADHQKEWQRLYQEILFGSKNGGQIEVPEWIRADFRYDGPCYNRLNSYHGTFFDKSIVWKAQEPLRGLNDPQVDTRAQLEERILGDWRACRLYIDGAYTTLIQDKDGKITSVDMGTVGRKTYNNSKELLELFMAGKKPYDNPSFIEFGE